MFIHKFTGTGQRDGGNGWYDIGATQIPIIGNVPMAFTFRSGENEFGDGEVWNQFIQPEATHLSAKNLPPHEHDLYLNDAGRTYHVFSNGAWLGRWSLDLYGSSYHDFTVELYGDWVDIVNGAKHPKPDPDHAMFRFGGDKWQRLNLMGENKLTQKVLLGSTPLSFEILTRYAVGGRGANGCFIKTISLQPSTVTKEDILIIYQSPIDTREHTNIAKMFPDAVVWISKPELVTVLGGGYDIYIPATHTSAMDYLDRLGIDYQTI